MGKLEGFYATSTDPRFDKQNIVDHDPKTFWVTTGMFPQEVVVALGDGSAFHLSRVVVHSRGIKHLVVSKTSDPQLTNWKTLIDTTVDDKGRDLQTTVHRASTS